MLSGIMLDYFYNNKKLGTIFSFEFLNREQESELMVDSPPCTLVFYLPCIFFIFDPHARVYK